MRVEPAICPVCASGYDPLRARAVAVRDGRVQAFCSADCKSRAIGGDSQPIDLSAGLGQPALDAPAEPPPDENDPSWSMRGVLAMAILGGAALGFGGKLLDTSPRPMLSALAPKSALAMKPIKAAPTLDDAMAMLSASGAKGSRIDEERDAWYHPLPGPKRRLPIRNTRRFGAAREGMRPEECRSGHCGVDLGETKGDWVIAAHDGVVERVVREDDGKEGRFVRINHKGGTVVTSYMHLDQIRPELKPGVPIKAGALVGTIGDTGIFHSGPHLHFAVSVRASIDETELFIDPEPLLHLWPLHAPIEPAPKRTKVAQAAESPSQ